MDVVDVVELVHDVGVVVHFLIPFSSGSVRYGVDLGWALNSRINYLEMRAVY